MIPRAPARTKHARPGPILLVGGDTVVSRALRLFLRKEGYETTSLSDDVGGWSSESEAGSGAQSPSALPAGSAPNQALVDEHSWGLVILATTRGPSEQAALCRRLRSLAATRSAPILAIYGAGEDRRGALSPGNAIPSSAAYSSLTPRALTLTGERAPGADAGDCAADASLAWPFRLREVLAVMEDLLAGQGSRA